jgi:hypothetical protein
MPQWERAQRNLNSRRFLSPQLVGSPFTQDPNFIKARCHLGKDITSVVNTEEEQVDIRARHDDMDSALL